jgi:hypothetical protein
LLVDELVASLVGSVVFDRSNTTFGMRYRGKMGRKTEMRVQRSKTDICDGNADNTRFTNYYFGSHHRNTPASD